MSRLGLGFGLSFGGGGGAFRARAVAATVPLTTGLLTTVSTFGLLAPVAFAKTGGSGNLSVAAATGGISATAALGAGVSQSLTGTASGADGCVLPFTATLTGVTATPTPSPTPSPTPTPAPTPTPTPGGIVTGVTAVGDMPIAITNPVAVVVPMQTNGRVMKVETGTSFTPAALDLTKVTLTVSDQGWDTNGNQVARNRTIGMREFLRGPWAENGYYQPVTGTFHLVLADHLYNQDATWRSTITSINFAAGWLPGAAAETVLSVTRQDSLAYWPLIMAAQHHPWVRIGSGGSYRAVWTAISQHARDKSQLACVESWAVDSAGTAGTVARGSVYAQSSHTPATGAVVPGLPVPAYETEADCTGLLAGRCGLRARFKPWIGPAVETFAYGDTYPSQNLLKETPFCYDPTGAHAPLYGVLVHDPASPPAGKTVIASNTAAATADVSGLALSIAGAEASGKVYANFATLLAAVRRVNASASALTLADGSYQRPSTHDDVSASVGVCPPVSGSAMGADLGAYSVRVNCGSTTTFPPGLVAAELRSTAGTPSTDVRWRGRTSEGTTLTLTQKTLPSRIRLRGLTLDSTGVTVAADNITVGGSFPGSAPTEASASCHTRIDCRVYDADPASLNVSASVVHYQPGYLFDRRVAHFNAQSSAAWGSTGAYGGQCVSVGSAYERQTGSIGWPVASALGCTFGNIGLGGQAAGGIQPQLTGQMLYNVRVATNLAAPTSAVIASASDRPIRRGLGLCMVFAYAPNATSMGPIIAIGNDGKRHEIDYALFQHVGSDVPLISAASFSADGRWNLKYNDQNFIRIDKVGVYLYTASRNWNVKGDDLDLPETSPATAWSNATAYQRGTIVNDAGLIYQAVADVPAGTALSDAAFWYATGLPSGTVFHQRSLRQGNADARYHIGSRGNVTAGTFDGNTVPGVATPLGFKWGPDEKTDAVYADYYRTRGSDYRAKLTGPLANRVPAGRAVTPFYLDGSVVMANDGTDAAGAWG